MLKVLASSKSLYVALIVIDKLDRLYSVFFEAFVDHHADIRSSFRVCPLILSGILLVISSGSIAFVLYNYLRCLGCFRYVLSYAQTHILLGFYISRYAANTAILVSFYGCFLVSDILFLLLC
jgi:hypothetical protein